MYILNQTILNGLKKLLRPNIGHIRFFLCVVMKTFGFSKKKYFFNTQLLLKENPPIPTKAILQIPLETLTRPKFSPQQISPTVTVNPQNVPLLINPSPSASPRRSLLVQVSVTCRSYSMGYIFF